jgi:hypothetical protein
MKKILILTITVLLFVVSKSGAQNGEFGLKGGTQCDWPAGLLKLHFG